MGFSPVTGLGDEVKAKVKVRALVIATLIRVSSSAFTTSELAANWHESMVPQHVSSDHPLPALTGKWTHGAANRHTIAPISHTLGLHPIAVATTHFPSR